MTPHREVINTHTKPVQVFSKRDLFGSGESLNRTSRGQFPRLHIILNLNYAKQFGLSCLKLHYRLTFNKILRCSASTLQHRRIELLSVILHQKWLRVFCPDAAAAAATRNIRPKIIIIIVLQTALPGERLWCQLTRRTILVDRRHPHQARVSPWCRPELHLHCAVRI